MTLAPRRPFRPLGPVRVVSSAGTAILLVGLLLSIPGLPTAPEPAQGAIEAPTPAPSAPAVVVPLDPVAHTTEAPGDSKRRAGPRRDVCRFGPVGTVPATVVSHGSRGEKVVALTFDDGFGGRNLRRILRLLREKEVNATFFPIGQAVRHDLDTWRMVADAGFPIANHTDGHTRLRGLCYADQLTELRRAKATFIHLLGVTPLPAMRPPGGELNVATRAAAAGAGESTIVLWDVDTRDWTGIGARQIARTALAGTKGSIVVLHTSSASTLRALPRIIRGYRKRGFEFVTIGQLLGIEGPVPFPAGPADPPPPPVEGRSP